jgi:PPOX class probable F420-dependent enzyme
MVQEAPSVRLPADVLSFLARPRHLVIATTNPDGSPHQAVVWYLLDGDQLIVNSRVGRRWPQNALRDPRVSLVAEEGDDYASITGTLEEIHDRELAQRHIATMARRYYDPLRAAENIDVFRTHERISFRVIPRRAEMRKS